MCPINMFCNAVTLQAVAHYFYNVINYNPKNKETSGGGIGGIANPIIRLALSLYYYHYVDGDDNEENEAGIIWIESSMCATL